MFSVPEGWLAGEVRDGFYIDSMMKRAWAAELKIFWQLQEFFLEYDIHYRLDYGTLLGAVRHGGFIPWDDDIDLTMTRGDYMKFMSVCDKLPYPLRAKTIYGDDDYYNQFHTVVCNTRDRILSYNEERMELYSGCPFIAAIDVFPFDYIPRNENDRKYQKLLYNIAFVLANRYDKEHDSIAFQKDLAALENQIGGSFNGAEPLRPQLFRLADRIAMMCPENDSDEVTYYTYMVTLPGAGIRRKEWYEKTVELPFEFITAEVPAWYNKVLSVNFGGYMNSSKHGAGHGYPFYEEQKEVLEFHGNLKSYAYERMEN
ncbi:MAG: LicD family protein [Lachnospiraceae bacterium]|nr:LicD family protein [Lachnospiraceae bacterium]